MKSSKIPNKTILKEENTTGISAAFSCCWSPNWMYYIIYMADTFLCVFFLQWHNISGYRWKWKQDLWSRSYIGLFSHSYSKHKNVDVILTAEVLYHISIDDEDGRWLGCGRHLCNMSGKLWEETNCEAFLTHRMSSLTVRRSCSEAAPVKWFCSLRFFAWRN